MKTESKNIRQIVDALNDDGSDSGLWLPRIQRFFVWSEEQIYRLFDSILREYPISTFLFWRTKDGVRRREFVRNWRSGIRLNELDKEEDEGQVKTLVLDGQQRLQSLFIGLKGSHGNSSRELYINILSGERGLQDDPEEMHYAFSFRDPSKDDVRFPYLKFKDLVNRDYKLHEKQAALCMENQVSSAEKTRIGDNLEQIRSTFRTHDLISYQVLDSTGPENPYAVEDVAEIFIRANSGGTFLSKSDLLFSLLSANTESLQDRVFDLAERLRQQGFGASRDFILKTCLVLLKQGSRYNVKKFRKESVLPNLESDWALMEKAIEEVFLFLREQTLITDGRVLSSYLPLVPLICFRYHCPPEWAEAQGKGSARGDLEHYLSRAILARSFTSQPDTVIDTLAEMVRTTRSFSNDRVFGLIRDKLGRPTTVAKQRLLEIKYGDGEIRHLFGLWYGSRNRSQEFVIDHIFPQALLRKVPDPKKGPRAKKYHQFDRDQIANCMLLTREENLQKSDTPLSEWLKAMQETTGSKEKFEGLLAYHLIPNVPSLWELENYEQFIEKRKEMIAEKFAHLLKQEEASPSD